MKPLVIIYISVGVFGLFFGQITEDLLSLGIRNEFISIVSKAIGATVIGLGAVALARGEKLPELPKPDSTFAP